MCERQAEHPHPILFSLTFCPALFPANRRQRLDGEAGFSANRYTDRSFLQEALLSPFYFSIFFQLCVRKCAREAPDPISDMFSCAGRNMGRTKRQGRIGAQKRRKGNKKNANDNVDGE